MNLFKAMIMCEECGEIHAEKWLRSENRHATTTTLFVLCDSCFENELRLSGEGDFDPFAEDFLPHEDDCPCKVCHADPFDYDDDCIESTPDASSCVKHKRFEDPYAGCPECNKEEN